MPKNRRALENLPRNLFEKDLLAIFNNVKKEILAKKNSDSKTHFTFLSPIERRKNLFFGFMIGFCLFAIVLLTVGAWLQLLEFYLVEIFIIASMYLSIFCEICWGVALFAEEVNKSKQRNLDNLEELWQEILGFHRESILKVAHLYSANKKTFDHAFALEIVRKGLFRKTAQLKSIEKRNDSYLPFFAFVFAVIVIIIFEALKWSFYKALGIATIPAWILYALKLLSSSDSPKLALCKQCTSIVEAMQLVNDFKNNQNITHSNKTNSSKQTQSVSAFSYEDNESASFLEATQEFAGCLEGGPEDLSVNKKYLEDLGKE